MESVNKIKLGYYRHFKGNVYKVLNTVKHSETEEWLVLYYPIKDDSQLWVRPLDNFLSKKITSDGSAVIRFEFIGETLPKEHL